VKARNSNGLSRESEFSNVVYVESPLPFGWNRILNGETREYAYINEFSNEFSSTRPDLDPYFLDESIVQYFHPRERYHLQKIYDEVST
jgi:hypothetical protein